MLRSVVALASRSSRKRVFLPRRSPMIGSRVANTVALRVVCRSVKKPCQPSARTSSDVERSMPVARFEKSGSVGDGIVAVVTFARSMPQTMSC